jgi:Zn-dependent peptidase ImmA (M78 family)
MALSGYEANYVPFHILMTNTTVHQMWWYFIGTCEIYYPLHEERNSYRGKRIHDCK